MFVILERSFDQKDADAEGQSTLLQCYISVSHVTCSAFTRNRFKRFFFKLIKLKLTVKTSSVNQRVITVGYSTCSTGNVCQGTCCYVTIVRATHGGVIGPETKLSQLRISVCLQYIFGLFIFVGFFGFGFVCFFAFFEGQLWRCWWNADCHSGSKTGWTKITEKSISSSNLKTCFINMVMSTYAKLISKMKALDAILLRSRTHGIHQNTVWPTVKEIIYKKPAPWIVWFMYSWNEFGCISSLYQALY